MDFDKSLHCSEWIFTWGGEFNEAPTASAAGEPEWWSTV